jgi:histidinol-phosphate aminotransferase
MTSRASTGPRPRAGIFEITPYVGGESGVPGKNRVIKLSSNETPFGPSPKAIEAYHAAADDLFSYPDGAAGDLKAALARAHGLETDRLVIGNGSDEILTLLAHAYLSPGDESIATEYSFLIYRIATLTQNAKPILTRETDFRTDVDAMVAALSPRTRIVYLCNPSNPTGTYLSKAEVERLHAALPPDVLLVIDAAYAEYATAEDYAPGDWLVRKADNVVMTRTFSKIYGLAALRLGWAYMPERVRDVLDRIRMPFNTGRPAQMTGIAALQDKAHMVFAQRHNAEWRERLTREIADLGIGVVPSQANFLMLDFTPLGGPPAAQAADGALKKEGLIVRRLDNYGIPQALRMTIGTEEANLAVVAALTGFVQDWKTK